MFQYVCKNRKKSGEKEKWHQRHNLTLLSSLPVARSGAVGYEVYFVPNGQAQRVFNHNKNIINNKLRSLHDVMS
jgi:hypothetical protein